MKAVASSADSGRLNGEDKVFIVGAVEEWHEALLTCESLIDEQVFFIVRHRVSEIDGFNPPTVPLELVDNPPSEVLVVDGIVRAEGSCIEVKYDCLVAMVGIVTAKIVNERRDFALELDVKGFYDV